MRISLHDFSTDVQLQELINLWHDQAGHQWIMDKNDKVQALAKEHVLYSTSRQSTRGFASFDCFHRRGRMVVLFHSRSDFSSGQRNSGTLQDEHSSTPTMVAL